MMWPVFQLMTPVYEVPVKTGHQWSVELLGGEQLYVLGQSALTSQVAGMEALYSFLDLTLRILLVIKL